jgi:stress response protein YsnF
VITQADESDRPFPGAHSQVPHRHADTDDPKRMPRALPLEATPVLRQLGWSIRLPVRAEGVVVEKQVVVSERVVVRRRERNDLARIDGRVRREQLKVDVEGTAHLSTTPASVDGALSE